MKIFIATPAAQGSLVGNRITAERYRSLFSELGHAVEVAERWQGEACDVLFALHAGRSRASLQNFQRAHPALPSVLVLTGTDLYGVDAAQREVVEALELTTLAIVLQPAALDAVPERLRERVRVVLQSAERAPPSAGAPLPGFEVAAIGHLRDVKDPLLVARAVRDLPAESEIHVVHAGRALDASWDARARAESAANPRWSWVGELQRDDTLALIARARAFVQSSLSEGGSSALAEAIVAGKPALVTRIPAAIGMLGADHPGFFEVGDELGLRTLLLQCERDARFLGELTLRSVALAEHFTRERERAALDALLRELSQHASRPLLRGRVRVAPETSATHELGREVRAGLSASPKRLPCRFFYDEEGSRIFEEICALPEYYLTRCEDEILNRHAREIVGRMPARFDLVELGSGSAAKTRRMIQVALERSDALRYVPIDISASVVTSSARALTAEFPRLEIDAIAAEYEAGLRLLERVPGRPALCLWLGSNVGNFDRDQAAQFLRFVRTTLSGADRLLIGIDLRKSKATLEPAYDDASGVTRRFNLNLLARINRELGGHFDLERFQHVARYDEELGRVEMYLQSRIEQRVRIEALELDVAFTAGERIHTENSYKYSRAEIDELARLAGFGIEQVWTDARGWFNTCLFAPLN